MSVPTISNIRRTTVKAFSLGIIVGGFITAATIAAIPAKATPDSTLTTVAIQEEPFICNTMALHPTVSGLMKVMSSVQAVENLSAYDTGTVVALAIYDGCDQFVPVLQRFVSIYAEGRPA